MSHRTLKALLVALVGLQALVWLANNLLNLSVAHGAVAYALSQQDQAGGYSNHLLPAISNELAATAGLVLILLGEAIAALACLYGSFAQWRARPATGDAYADAQRYAVLGCGAAILVWFGLFGVFGGGVVMMGQAEGLRGALEGAFRYAGYSFLTLIYLSIPDAPLRQPRVDS